MIKLNTKQKHLYILAIHSSKYVKEHAYFAFEHVKNKPKSKVVHVLIHGDFFRANKQKVNVIGW